VTAGVPPLMLAESSTLRFPVRAFFARGVAMLPTQLLSVLHKPPLLHALVVPALCRVRKGRGTRCVLGASEVKAGPPAKLLLSAPLQTGYS
jgi:hypothetical protein